MSQWLHRIMHAALFNTALNRPIELAFAVADSFVRVTDSRSRHAHECVCMCTWCTLDMLTNMVVTITWSPVVQCVRCECHVVIMSSVVRIWKCDGMCEWLKFCAEWCVCVRMLYCACVRMMRCLMCEWPWREWCGQVDSVEPWQWYLSILCACTWCSVICMYMPVTVRDACDG